MTNAKKRDRCGQHENNTTLCALFVERYGPIMDSKALREALCFSSAAAFRKAISRGQVGVQTFALNERRGHFALTTEVAGYLQKQLEKSSGSRPAIIQEENRSNSRDK